MRGSWHSPKCVQLLKMPWGVPHEAREVVMPRRRRMRPPGAAQIARARGLRQTATNAERMMWCLLRNRSLRKYKFRRQHPLGPYVADFYCAECRLVVELDGVKHAESEEYDATRTEWMERYGIRVIRFPNKRLNDELPMVLAEILAACGDGAESRE